MIALAQKPTVKSRDRLQIGPVTVHRLADMEDIAWPVAAIFRDLTGSDLREAADRYPGCAEPQAARLLLSFNSYIVDMPGCLCLIDCGIGNGKERPDRPLWHRRDGDFMQRLDSLGYAADRFDLVVNTHLHADHVGWNTTATADGWTPTFKNARYVVPQSELALWQRLAAQHPDGHVLHGAFADSVQPLLDAGIYQAVVLPSEIAPGLWLEPAPGHTPGMAVVRLKLPQGGVLFLADVLHSPLQLAAPELTSNFCADPAQASATRHRLLAECAQSNAIVATYHFPPPVFGHVVTSGAGYRFEPLM